MSKIINLEGDQYDTIAGVLVAQWCLLGADAANASNAVAAALRTVAAPGWQPITTAPKDGSDIMACWPKHQLDDDDQPTGPITGHALAVTSWHGYWIEPDYLDAIGESFGDDEGYAADPTHWMPLPAPPVGAEA